MCHALPKLAPNPARLVASGRGNTREAAIRPNKMALHSAKISVFDSCTGSSLTKLLPPCRFRWFNPFRNCRFSLFWEIGKPAKADARREPEIFQPSDGSNEGVFCSDDRILLGLIAASLVLPLDGLARRSSQESGGPTI